MFEGTVLVLNEDDIIKDKEPSLSSIKITHQPAWEYDVVIYSDENNVRILKNRFGYTSSKLVDEAMIRADERIKMTKEILRRGPISEFEDPRD